MRKRSVLLPGAMIVALLDERGWSQIELSEVLDRPVQAINELCLGKKRITPQTAVELAAAFRTDAEFWLALERDYRLALADTPEMRAKCRAIQERKEQARRRVDYERWQEAIGWKRCNRCAQVQRLAAFRRDADRPGMRSRTCSKCYGAGRKRRVKERNA